MDTRYIRDTLEGALGIHCGYIAHVDGVRDTLCFSDVLSKYQEYFWEELGMR